MFCYVHSPHISMWLYDYPGLLLFLSHLPDPIIFTLLAIDIFTIFIKNRLESWCVAPRKSNFCHFILNQIQISIFTIFIYQFVLISSVLCLSISMASFFGNTLSSFLNIHVNGNAFAHRIVILYWWCGRVK